MSKAPMLGGQIPKAPMIPHGRSDPADREFSPLLECSGLSPGSMGKPLRIHLNQTYFNPLESIFFLWGLCDDLYTRICCILVTFGRFLSTRQIMSTCSNASSTCSSGLTDKPWCKLIRLIHLDRFALEFCLQGFCSSQCTGLTKLFPICPHFLPQNWT